MPKFKPLEPIDLSFFDRAPLRVESTMVARCAPEDFMETIRGDTIWTEWAPAIKKVNWTSTPPHRQGSTRDVTLSGNMVVREVFFHWEENERVAFYVNESNIPNLRVFAEDYRIERISAEETKLTWVVGIHNTGFMTLFNPVMPFILKRVFQGWLSKYKELLEARVEERAGQRVSDLSGGAQPRA